MPQLDPSTWAPQLIWLAISFVALYFIMARIALPRVGATIEIRKATIAGDLDAAHSLKGETEQALADYDAAVAGARSSGQAIALEGRRKLDAALEQERAKLDSDLGMQVIKAEKRIGDLRQAALDSVEQMASELAASIVTQLGGSRISRKAAAEVVAQIRPN